MENSQPSFPEKVFEEDEQILTSIMGCNSVENLRKVTFYNPNVDLVNDNVLKNRKQYVHSFTRY